MTYSKIISDFVTNSYDLIIFTEVNYLKEDTEKIPADEKI